MAASALSPDPAGANNKLTFTAKDDGVEFNALSIEYIDPGAASQALAVTFNGFNIKVYLATDGASAVTTIASAINTAVCGRKAANTLTSNNTNVSDGDTVTIGSTTYRFKTVTAAINDIFIGADADTSLGSLVKVLAGTAVIAASGADAFTGTKNGHSQVTAAAVSGHATVITARAPGTAYNVVPTTKVAATLTWTDTATLGGASATTIGLDSIDTALNAITGVSSSNPRRTMHLLSCANFAGNDGTGTAAAVAAAFLTGSTLEPTTGYTDVATAQLAGWVFLGTTTTGAVTKPTPQNLHYGAAEVIYQAYHRYPGEPSFSLQTAPSAAALLIATKLFAAQRARKGSPLLIQPWKDPTLWAS